LKNTALINSVSYCVFNIIPAIAFAAYICLGNVLDLPMALTAISYFDRLIWGV